MSLERDHYVYVVGVEIDGKVRGPVKIGISQSPVSRLAALQTGNHSRLVLCATFAVPDREIAQALERGFHAVQSSKQVNGEWFDMEPIVAVQLMCINIRTALFAAKIPGDVLDGFLERCGVLEWERKFQFQTEGNA